MTQNVALIVALAARLEVLFKEIPENHPATRKAVLAYAGYVLDHVKPQAMLAAVPKVEGESAIAYLVRNLERIKTVPEYRWPKIRGAAEHLPNSVFAPTAAAQEILRGKSLAPAETLELLSWLEPVFTRYPALKEGAMSAIRGAALPNSSV